MAIDNITGRKIDPNIYRVRPTRVGDGTFSDEMPHRERNNFREIFEAIYSRCNESGKYDESYEEYSKDRKIIEDLIK